MQVLLAVSIIFTSSDIPAPTSVQAITSVLVIGTLLLIIVSILRDKLNTRKANAAAAAAKKAALEAAAAGGASEGGAAGGAAGGAGVGPEDKVSMPLSASAVELMPAGDAQAPAVLIIPGSSGAYCVHPCSLTAWRFC